MNIVINRIFTKDEFTHGQLTIDGNRVCSTLDPDNALKGRYNLAQGLAPV